LQRQFTTQQWARCLGELQHRILGDILNQITMMDKLADERHPVMLAAITADAVR